MSCPPILLLVTYVVYLGLATTASVPLLAPVDWVHEGERLGSAQVVLSGGLPHKDAYLTHGLFPDVIRPLFAFQLFGESIASDRLLGIFLEPLAYVAAVYYLWHAFPEMWIRYVGMGSFALFPLLLVPRHILVFLGLAFLTQWIRQQKRSRLFLAGATPGLAFLGSTMEQASFLLATVLAFPFVWLASVYWSNGPSGSIDAGSIRTPWRNQVLAPLSIGMLVGFVPFVGYLLGSTTGDAFLSDLLNRATTDMVVNRDPYPPLSVSNFIWYGVPATYGASGLLYCWRVLRGDRAWRLILPTLLFGGASFIYAVHGCCPTYGKLATVAFPFIVLVVQILYLSTSESTADGSRRAGLLSLNSSSGIFIATVFAALLILLQSLTQEWTHKQIIPRYLFPLFSLMIIGVALAAMGRVPAFERRRRFWLTTCPVAALTVSVWLFANAKPQVLAAQLQKPRLVSHLGQLIPLLVKTGGRLSRDRPPYVEDETLKYLEGKARLGQRVVIFAAGAGVYYFLAKATPPNRFAEVYHAMSDHAAREVIESLILSRAELLIACGDEGQRVTGWPMNPHLSSYVLGFYRDTEVRLRSQLLGEGCSFSIWTHQEMSQTMARSVSYGGRT